MCNVRGKGITSGDVSMNVQKSGGAVSRTCVWTNLWTVSSIVYDNGGGACNEVMTAMMHESGSQCP